MASSKAMLTTGIVGAIIAALCCFTPVLVILAGAMGLAALIGYLDYVLLPALFFFIALTVYALYRRREEQRCCNPDADARRSHIKPLRTDDDEPEHAVGPNSAPHRHHRKRG